MTADTESAREDPGSGGRYVLRRNGIEAEMPFSRLGGARIIVDHTGPPDAMRGHGAGLALARQVVADARAGGLTVVAPCPFPKAQARGHPDGSDGIA